MEIFVESFANIKLDGIAAGDAFSVYSNYPELASDLLAAIVAYDEGRQSIRPQIDLSAVAEALTVGSFDEWLTENWATPSLLRANFSLMAGLDSGDFEKIRSSFHAISAVNPPSQSQLEEWQGILDDLEVPKDVLAFIPNALDS